MKKLREEKKRIKIQKIWRKKNSVNTTKIDKKYRQNAKIFL